MPPATIPLHSALRGRDPAATSLFDRQPGPSLGATLAEPSNQSFVGTRLVDGHRLVEIDNVLVLDSFAQLDRILTTRVGRNVAALFAEPRITRGNGAAPTRVDWYARFDGVVRPLHQLDASSAAAVRRTLETRLAAVRSLVFDPECGPLVAAALNLASPDAIISVGGDPVLIDWGMLPVGVRDERARARHFDATLGPLLSGMPLPPLSRAEWTSRFGGAGAAAARQPEAVLASSPPAIAHMSDTRRPMTLWTPAVAVLLAALVLGFLMVPGVLSFPTQAAADASRATDAGLGQMENRRRQLEAALAADCPVLLQQAAALLGAGAIDRPAATPVRRN